MNFGEAIEHLKKGGRTSRPGWNGKDMWIGLHLPKDNILMEDNIFMEVPFIYMCTAEGKLVPWVASQTDMLAEDWVTI